jgi:hypothetical protein
MKINLAQIAPAFLCFQIATHSQTVPVPDEGPARYVMHILSVAPAQRDDFVACLAQDEVPFWRGLKEKRLLATVSVFETTAVSSSEGGVPAWNFFLLSQLPSGASAESLAEAFVKRRSCDSTPGVEVRRTETLRTTPTNSNYARSTADADREARELKVEFGIEYIAVKAAALNQYLESMRLNLGPPAGLQIQEGSLFSLVTLETVKVHYSQPGMPYWNQIHLSGSAPGKNSVAAVDSALRRANPQSGGYEAVYSPLRAMRTKPRVDRVRQLFELAVR